MRTDKQIDSMVAKLKKLKPKVRHFSLFGDDNHAKIDAVIRCLEKCQDEDDIAVLMDIDYDLYSLLSDAVAWMEGDDEKAPNKNWPLEKDAKSPSPELMRAMDRVRHGG